MTLQTNFNIAPYFDDYTESKNFLRFLFKPGLAVQARELTQLQTLLQKQTERLGAHIFQDGSKVLGGDLTLNVKVKSLKIETQFAGVAVNVYNFVGKTIVDTSSNATATVVQASTFNIDEPATLFYNSLNDQVFDDGHTIRTSDSVYRANTVSANGVSGLTNAVSSASLISISEGIFFVSGFFIYCAPQTIILDRYSNTPSYRVGVRINEEIISSITDNSLLDNAQGAFNYTAPGSDRFKITLTLDKEPITSSNSQSSVTTENFIELIRIENGVIVNEIKYPFYSEIEKTLARRTFDESGNYTVRPFGLQLVDHRGGNTALVSAGLQAGKAYVKGYEFETISTRFLDVERARETKTVTNYGLSAVYGNKVYLKQVLGGFNVDKHELVDLHSVPWQYVNAATSTSGALDYYNSTKMGTARIRSFDFETFDTASANVTHFHSKYESSLYDIRLTTNINGTIERDANNAVIYLPSSITSNVSGAYFGSTITVNTTANGVTSSDTVRIREYIAAGLDHIAFLELPLSQNVVVGSTFSIAYDIGQLESIAVVHANPEQTASANQTDVVLTSKANIDTLSKYNQDSEANTIIIDTNRNTLLYPLPYTPAATLPNGLTYYVKKTFNQTSDATGSLTIQTSDGSFAPSETTSLIRENYTVVVTDAGVARDIATDVALSNGQILDFETGSGRSITRSDANASATIACSTTSDIEVEVTATVRLENKQAKTKTIVNGNVSTISPSSNIAMGQIRITNPNKSPLGKDNLFLTDVFNVIYVIDSQAPEQPVSNTHLEDVLADPNHDRNITDRYILDTGQKDNFYDFSSLVLKRGAQGPLGQITVIVDYFQHTGSGFFSVDSYPNGATYNNGANTFTYTSIPSYTSPRTGEVYQLRNVLDFRPTRNNANNADGANTVDSMGTSTDAYAATQFIGSGGIPDAEYELRFDQEFYLNRVDKLALTKDRQFKVIKGVPDVRPVPPSDDVNAMTLYTLTVPAYTFNVSDIRVRYNDNKRYTMRDIGELERRIENLEYYTSLSFLEKETASLDISGIDSVDSLFNPRGDRFKNGILVDSFIGHAISDITNDDFQAAIDPENGELRPSFDSDFYDVSINTIASNTHTNSSGGVTSNIEGEDEVVTQPSSSVGDDIQVNPSDVAVFVGSLFLYPSTDAWYDNTVRPVTLVNENGENDNWKYGNSNSVNGTQWNDWSTYWTGTPITYENVVDADGGSTLSKTDLITQAFTRSGIKVNNIPNSIIKIIGNKTVDLSILPFMRATKIHFAASALKPDTDVYVYFDGEDVSSYTTQASVLTLAGISGSDNFQVGEQITQGVNTALIIARTQTTSNTALLTIKVLFASDGNANNAFVGDIVSGVNSGLSGTITNRSDYSMGSQLRTNSYGELNGYVSIVAQTYNVGDRLLRVTDQPLNITEQAETFAEATFHVAGLLDTESADITSTKPVDTVRDTIESEDIVNSIIGRITADVTWLNPLVQVFSLNQSEHPNGLYISSVDLFFKSKPTTTNLPIKIQVRPVVNGFPMTNTVLPMTEVVLRPEEVNVIDGTPDVNNQDHITKFKFRAPVFLEPGLDYAITIITNSSEYVLHAAVAGKFQGTTEERIVSQPNVGSVFYAQNAGQWIERPDVQLMFNLWRAVFATGDTTIVIVNDGTPASNNDGTTSIDVAQFISSTIVPETTSVDFYYSTGGPLQGVDINTNIFFDERTDVLNGETGALQLFAVLNTQDNKISPFLDMERTGIITVKNNINTGGLTNTTFTVVDGGQDYQIGDTAEIIGGDATSQAEVSLVIDANTGTITAVTVTSPGTNYITTPTIAVTSEQGCDAVIDIAGETSSGGGPSGVKYITRRVTLEDGFDASDLKVIITAYKPQSAQIFVYVKIKSDLDTGDFNDREYILLEQETDYTSINEQDTYDFVFKSPNESLNYKVGSTVYETFKTFAVKIIMNSTSTTDVPRIKDMRAIALDA